MGEKIQKQSLNVLYLTVFIDMLGFGVIIPLLPYLVGKLGASGLYAASLLSIFSLMQFIFSPILGRLSDRYGRKNILALCLLGSIISYALYALAFVITKQPHTTLLLIFISRLLAGVMGANIPLAYSYIADNTPVEGRAGAMGKIGAAFGLGFIFGPAISGILTPYGLAAPGLVAMIISGFALICALYFLKDPKKTGCITHQLEKLTVRQLLNILTHRVIGKIILASLLYGLAFVQMEAIYSLFIGHVYHLTQSQIANLFVFVGVVVAISQGALVGPLSKAIGNMNLLILGCILLAISYVLIYHATTIPMMLISSAGIALAAGAINPTLVVIVSRYVDQDKQGLTQGIVQSASSLSRVVGPLIAGVLYDRSVTSPFLLGCLLMIIVIVIAYVLKGDMMNKKTVFYFKNKFNRTGV